MAWPASPGGFINNLDVFKSGHYESLMGLSDTISCLFLLLYDFPKDISSRRLRECLSGLLPPMGGGWRGKGDVYGNDTRSVLSLCHTIGVAE